MLADEGFDVWLGNSRGVKVSREHRYLNPDLSEYWDYSWHEIGKYDMPAMIDTILRITNQSSLQYIGHSQGTTTLFVMLSLWPEYNQKIISAHLMTPAVYFRNARIVLRVLSTQLDSFQVMKFDTFCLWETLSIRLFGFLKFNSNLLNFRLLLQYLVFMRYHQRTKILKI